MIPAERFTDAIRSVGLVPPEVIQPDKFHRFPGNGKGGRNRAAWCKQFADGNGGVFGDFSSASGFVETWQAKRERPLSTAERVAFARQVEEARRQAEAERAAQHAAAAEKAARIWNASKPLVDHPYLRGKAVPAFGLRQYGDALVIPMRDSAGRLHSLQFITANGEKRFLSGGAVRGNYHSIGRPDGGTICIAEGYATGASVHEATGHAVAVAFDAGNLLAVVLALRTKYSDARLIVCADDDNRTEGNPGIAKATEAARAVGGLLAVPDFGPNRPEGTSDFNDMAAQRGREAVKQAVANACAPARAEPHPSSENATTSDPAGCIAYRRASEIQAKPIRWLWHGRIARGKVAILAGNPGLGKSQVTVSMAAVVSTGGTWPVDRTRCERGNVIFLSAEDDPEDTIRPRLEAAGADLSRVFILGAVVERFTAHGDDVVRAFNLKTDLTRLGELLEKIGDVAMIVIDPITAYLGDADSHKNAEIRALLSPLADLAAKHGAAVVCVSHLNKSSGGEALMRVTGSLAFVAAARSAWLVAKDLEDETRRLFLPLKNNIGNDQSGFAFAVRSAQVKSIAGLIETSCVAWEAEAVTVTADEAMASQGDPEERSAIEDARQFLAGLLADGPVHAGQVKKDADGAGFNWRTVQRAADRLGVERHKEGMRGGWVWKLAPKMTDHTEGDTQITVAPSGGVVAFGGDSGPVEVEI